MFNTMFSAQATFSEETYGICYKVYYALPENSKVIVTAPLSSCLWYYELMEKKNITIFDTIYEDWFERNEILFTRWNIGASETEAPKMRVPIEDYSEYIKILPENRLFICREIIKEINSMYGKVFICR